MGILDVDPRLTGGETSHTLLTIGSAIKLNFTLIQPNTQGQLCQLKPSIWWVSRLTSMQSGTFEAVSAEHDTPIKFNRCDFGCAIEVLKFRPIPTTPIQKDQVWISAIPIREERLRIVYYKTPEIIVCRDNSIGNEWLFEDELRESYNPFTE